MAALTVVNDLCRGVLLPLDDLQVRRFGRADPLDERAVEKGLLLPKTF